MLVLGILLKTGSKPERVSTKEYFEIVCDRTHHNFFGSFNSRNVCAGVHLVDKRFMLEYKFVSCRIKGYENMFFKT